MIATKMKPNTFTSVPGTRSIPGNAPDSSIGLVPMLLLPATSYLTLRSR